MTRWPVHPQPKPYELLYCWVKRISKIYNISYNNFCSSVLKLTPEEISELRHCLPEKAIAILSKGTGIPKSDLRERYSCGIYRKLAAALEESVKEE